MTSSPIHHGLLASFLEYATNDVITSGEWERFAVNYFDDEIMEKARCECVRIFIDYINAGDLPLVKRERFFKLASELRDAT
jgi:hypothetical protein